MIEIRNGQIFLDGVHAGGLVDCKANYPDLADDIQTAWDAATHSESEE